MTEPAPASSIARALTGTLPMIGLTLRRERVRGTAWYVVCASLLMSIAAGVVATYPTTAERVALAASVNDSTAELFMIGPVTSTGADGIALWRMLGIASILISLASILVVVRNTRALEESGTSEMLGSAAVGRAAPLASVLVVAAAGSLGAGVVTGVGFVSIGAPAGGCVLVGAQVTMLGVLAAALAGLTSQVVQTARAAAGSAVATTAVLFVLRGTGDVIGGDARWLSPLGWIAAVRPFAHENAWMLLPSLGLALGLAGLALGIAAGRDLGAGLAPHRTGAAHAGTALRGPMSLALRVSRGAIVGWGAGAFAVGLLVGGVSSTVDGQIALSLGSGAGSSSGLVDVALRLSPLFAAALGIQTTLRMRDEIASGRAEAVLSRRVARTRWLIAHSVAGGSAAAVLLLALGLGTGLAQLGTDPGEFGTLAIAGVVRVPAAWAFVAVTTLLLASVPRAASLTFVLVGAFQALDLAVEFRALPAAAIDLSPFALVPQLPDGDDHLWQTTLLVAITGVLLAIAASSIRRQDIHPARST